ncbi:glucan -beta-glucosidase [Chrysochromulina tobinii]|uniref:Glucan-beta-glucosidase n=1 Tax=Chrysochromulina tobinii TaxID=1460289 RepID=A0A0M0J8F4_9EUKA|nr:glucan -beta-glucosidase [Chrysochromulina tobinii]|eukprot:KOO22760.1 glucan -beta-glucosidase [Chrysochromulina sp. CCMP291]
MLTPGYSCLPPHDVYAFCNVSLAESTRLDDLIGKLTTTELIGQLFMDADLAFGNTTYPNSSKGDLKSTSVPRLGIAQFSHLGQGSVYRGASNGCNLNCCTGGKPPCIFDRPYATVFPQGTGFAASFDTKLVFEAAVAIADESRSFQRYVSNRTVEYRSGASSVINIARDPRWGRVPETYGECPTLTGKLAVAFNKGLMGFASATSREPPSVLKLLPVMRHFAAYAGPERTRFSFNARVNEKDLELTYLPAWRRLVREGALVGVMSAISALNGVPGIAHRTLLTHVLRDTWLYEGFVLSDCDTFPSLLPDTFPSWDWAGSAEQAAADALGAGNDINCGPGFGALLNATRLGFVNRSVIALAARRVLRMRMRVGDLQPPQTDPWWEHAPPLSVVGSPEHGAIVDALVAGGTTLLHHTPGTLPIGPPIFGSKARTRARGADTGSVAAAEPTASYTIALIGPSADDVSIQAHTYHGTPSEWISLRTAMEAELGGRATLTFAPGCAIDSPETSGFAAALALAQTADAVVYAAPMVLPPNLAALLCLALTSSPPKVHTTTPSARRPFPTKTPRAATLQLSALGRSEDANTRRARVMASAANNVTTAPPELAPFIETLANQLPSAWASLPEALRKFLPDYEPDEALAGKDMAAKAAAEEAEAAAQKVLAMRAKRMGAESVMAVETSKKEQHNNILTTYGADYGAEAPAPTREYSSSYGVDAGAGAGASAGGSTRQGGPPIDEERRNRSPGLQRNFYDAPPSDQGSATPYGVDYGLPPGTQFGAETPLEGQARERAMAAFKARAGSESPADVSARVLSIRTMYSALNVPVDASMTRWTDAELGEYFASGGLNRPGMPKPQPGQAPEAAPYVPPPIDQDRRSRSPGLSRNFYEIPTADFKRPHGGSWHWPGPKGTDDDPEASPGPEAEAEAPEDNAPEPPKKEKKDWDAEKAKKDAAWEAKKAPEKAPVPVAAAPASSEETGRAQVLVVVSDHGSGTSTFGKALQTHPCMFDLGETFTANYPWSSTKNLKACGESQDRSAIFDAESGLLLRKSNDQLSSKFASSFDDKEIQVGSKAADGADPSLYANLPYDLGEYFVRMRDLICKNVPEKMCAPSECSITVKMFPQFFDGTTGGFSDADDKPSECTIARNDAALKAWKKELASMTANPKVATLALIRYERDRQFSTFHRFTAPGTKFDCSFPRKPYDFAVVANQVADGHIQIENCWTGAAGAAECLKNALSLVGLTPELMGDKGTTLMTGGTKESISSKASSCSTDPDATFVSEKNDEVKMIHGELTTFYYVKMVANVDEDEAVASPSPEAREA